MTVHPLDIEPLADRPSLLGGWDPRAKLLGLAPLILVQACLTTLPAAAVGATISLALLAAGRLPIGFCMRRIGLFAAFLAPFLLLLPLLGSGPVALQLGRLHFHAGGLEFAGLIGLRALGIVATTLAILNTAHLADTLWAARSLGVPRSLVQIALLTLRYLPILAEEYRATTTAAACRGFVPRANTHTYRVTANLAGAMLVRGHRRTDRVWQAMACRGFAGKLYPLRNWQMTFHDTLATMVMATASVAILVWDRWL
ncbi:MAG: cobalt ECF transporter T component CbiQ [Phycisphaerae bacterium]|nr:cobalt ECF transporter T component CbiQ [Phycisphaerae bacterium]